MDNAADKTMSQRRTMFEQLFERSPDALIIVDGHGMIDCVNARAEVLFGFPRDHMLGRPVEMLLSERFRDKHVALRVNYMANPRMRSMVSGRQLAARRADGVEFPVDIMLSRIEIGRRVVMAVVRDITERRRAEAQTQRLMQEVNHRAKNLLNVGQAIAQRTAASASQDFISRFSERIRSLSASLDLLVRNARKNIPLPDLVRSQLSHFGDLLDNRNTVRGPDLEVAAPAAQAIGRTIHELATNAAKCGALSNDNGCVDVVWRLPRPGHRFMMEWHERDGPTVTSSTVRGFGWGVLCQLTKETLGADVTLKYDAAGVVWQFGCPADRVCDDCAIETPTPAKPFARTA